MIKLGQLLRAARLLARGDRIGDGAALKADALGARASPETARQLAPLRDYTPVIDLAALRQLPEGSFGRAYARHMDDCGLTPITVTDALEADVRSNVFAVRYAATHDMFHVLLGFDTSHAGEIGVLAFAAAQGYSPQQRISLGIARFLYLLQAPSQRARISTSLDRGRALAQKADCLLAVRLEQYWAESLDSLRARLGLA